MASRTFLSQLIAQFLATRGDFVSPLQPTPIALGTAGSGTTDEVVVTTDPLVNFAQLAVRICQRSQGDKNKVMREAWVRLCGTYQSRGGLLAAKEVRKVRIRPCYHIAKSPIASEMTSLKVAWRFKYAVANERTEYFGGSAISFGRGRLLTDSYSSPSRLCTTLVNFTSQFLHHGANKVIHSATCCPPCWEEHPQDRRPPGECWRQCRPAIRLSLIDHWLAQARHSSYSRS